MRPQGLCLKNSNVTMGNRTRDLPACSAVRQPTVPPAACPSGHKISNYVVFKIESNRVCLCLWLSDVSSWFTPCICRDNRNNTIYVTTKSCQYIGSTWGCVQNTSTLILPPIACFYFGRLMDLRICCVLRVKSINHKYWVPVYFPLSFNLSLVLPMREALFLFSTLSSK